jgi:hypothetical protein
MRLGTSFQRQRAGAVDHARVVGHEGQAHGLAAGGDDGVLEGHHLLGCRSSPAGAGGFFHFEVVGTHEGAVAAHVVTLRILAMAARPPVSLPMTFSLWPRSLSMLTTGAPKSTPRSAMWLTSSITAATCSSALAGMQPTFRHTPPRWRSARPDDLQAQVGRAEGGLNSRRGHRRAPAGRTPGRHCRPKLDGWALASRCRACYSRR